MDTLGTRSTCEGGEAHCEPALRASPAHFTLSSLTKLPSKLEPPLDHRHYSDTILLSAMVRGAVLKPMEGAAQVRQFSNNETPMPTAAALRSPPFTGGSTSQALGNRRTSSFQE